MPPRQPKSPYKGREKALVRLTRVALSPFTTTAPAPSVGVKREDNSPT